MGLFTRDQSFMELGVILADVHITYLAPIYHGQNIKVGARVAKLGTKSMTWEQNVLDSDTGQELSRGEIVVVAYDYVSQKTIPIPRDWREKIIRFEGLQV
jgi:acyl-CoA thioester hydrolase